MTRTVGMASQTAQTLASRPPRLLVIAGAYPGITAEQLLAPIEFGEAGGLVRGRGVGQGACCCRVQSCHCIQRARDFIHISLTRFT